MTTFNPFFKQDILQNQPSPEIAYETSENKAEFIRSLIYSKNYDYLLRIVDSHPKHLEKMRFGGLTVLGYAVYIGDLHLVKFFSRCQFDLYGNNFEYKKPPFANSEYLKEGYDVDCLSIALLSCGLTKKEEMKLKYFKIAEYLLNFRPQLANSNFSLVSFVNAMFYLPQFCEKMLQKNKDLAIKIYKGMPVIFCCRYLPEDVELDMIDILVSNGASVNSKDISRRGYLYYIFDNPRDDPNTYLIKVVQHLFKRGFKFDEKTAREHGDLSKFLCIPRYKECQKVSAFFTENLHYPEIKHIFEKSFPEILYSIVRYDLGTHLFLFYCKDYKQILSKSDDGYDIIEYCLLDVEGEKYIREIIELYGNKSKIRAKLLEMELDSNPKFSIEIKEKLIKPSIITSLLCLEYKNQDSSSFFIPKELFPVIFGITSCPLISRKRKVANSVEKLTLNKKIRTE